MNVFSALGSAMGKARAAYYDAAERTYSRKSLSYSRAQGRSEDKAVSNADRLTIINQAMDLYRNDPMIHGIIERFADNVIGSGLTPQAKTSDPEFNKEAEGYIAELSKAPEVSGRFSMVDVQRMTLRAPFVSGDMLLMMLQSGKIQLIEGERIRTPDGYKTGDMFDGVKVDKKTGEIIGFEVYGRDENGAVTGAMPHNFVDMQDSIYLCKPFRPDQYRGLPEIASIITLARDLKEIREAMVKKVKMEAKDAKVIKTESGSIAANMGIRGSTLDSTAQPLTELNDGQIYYLRPNESIEGIESKSPNPQMAQFVNMMIRICGASIGLPYEFVLQDFSTGSFSASRAALLQTYQTFSMWQQWIVSDFLNRWYVWAVRRAVEKRIIRKPPTVNGKSEIDLVYWNFPEWEWVDPQSQQQADLIAFQLGVKSHTDLVAKRGKDSEDVLREKFRNMATAQRLADETNKASGTNFTWQDGIFANIPGQVQGASEQKEPPK